MGRKMTKTGRNNDKNGTVIMTKTGRNILINDSLQVLSF